MISKLPWKFLTYVCPKTKETVKVTTRIMSPKYTLINGQAFNWHTLEIKSEEKKDDVIFHGVLSKYYIQITTNKEGFVNYRAIPDDKELQDLFYDYFQFQYDYEKLISEWEKCDKHFAEIIKTFRGLRLLRQDPFECLIEFICSQNNNIPRITQLIKGICSKYGELLIEIDGEKYFKFPRIEQMKKASEETLRDMKFGYRARYITECIKAIEAKGGEKWLLELRGKDHETIHAELTSLMGIGKKVADCIALFSLDCKASIPVDTHVFQIFHKVYNNKVEKKAMTDKKYFEISKFFQDKFGEYAGWAHSYLFTADLARFKGENLIEKVKDEPSKKRKANELTGETVENIKQETKKQSKRTSVKKK